MDFGEIEKKVLKFWKDNKIFEKSIAQREKSRDFVFYEGPPTANGRPGIHHLETRAFKDVICRYKTMKGFRVLRKAGWDTHGLPVELEVEKELEFKSKKDIEKFGLAKFNKKCKKSVWKYKTEWEQLTEKIGYWLDLDNPYITYDIDYIETLWWIIKQVYEKGLLYQDYRVVPYCPRCGTSLSSHEVAQGYKKIKEPSIYVKFPIKGQKNTYFLVWTTTPWTLPGNAAVAVNPKFTYAKIKAEKEYLILAKHRIKESRIEGKIVKEIKGKDLVGLEYAPLYQRTANSEQRTNNIFKIIAGDFVSLDEGTGLVHIAPAFGEDDMAVGKKNNLPVLVTVDEHGKMLTKGYKWDKMFVKKADPIIVEDLETRKMLFKQELYEHDYPFCWRCKTPLIHFAMKSWFIQMTKIKQDLIKNNQKINWVPSHFKQGRFGEWLKDLKDWNISRERYWGTPLPIWKCQECAKMEIIGNKEDLIKQKFTTNKYFVLRHSESECFKKEIGVSKPGKDLCPLTKKGREQTKKAAQELKKEKIDIIFASDVLRTKQTAEIVGKELGIKVKFDKRLREINFGIYDKKPLKEWRGFWQNRSNKLTKKPPLGGENYTNAKKRMYRCLQDIDKKYKDKKILIVSHSGPILMLASAVKGLSNEEILKLLKKEGALFPVGKWHKIDFRILPYNEQGELDFHRPYIDEVKFFCPKCRQKMERVPEVLDCWFDSGAMPFAQNHWPFNNRVSAANNNLKPPKLFPADYICEAVDQTRGWFYTLLAVSSLLDFGNSYKNVICLGLVLDEKGEKMSKSKGNVVNPWYVIDKFGADASRWYFYTINQAGDSKLFTEKDVDQALKKFVFTLFNVYAFLETYASNPLRHLHAGGQVSNPKHILDKWVISKLNGLVMRVGKKMDEYDVVGAARDIEDFTINDLSLWYVRRSRKRFQRPQNKLELKQAGQTLEYVLMELSKLCAPFVPFVSEYIYQNIYGKKKSAHLEDWPKENKKLIDEKLEKQMEIARKIVGEALAQRAKSCIKVRQPLNELRIQNYDLRFKNNEELLGLIKDEINVKNIVFDSKIKNKQELDTKITAELKEQGIVREVIRTIQGMRKSAEYKPHHKILIRYSGDEKLNKILEKNKEFILMELTAKDFLQGKRPARNASRSDAGGPKQVFDIEKKIKIDQQYLWLGIKKI